MKKLLLFVVATGMVASCTAAITADQAMNNLFALQSDVDALRTKLSDFAGDPHFVAYHVYVLRNAVNGLMDDMLGRLAAAGQLNSRVFPRGTPLKSAVYNGDPLLAALAIEHGAPISSDLSQALKNAKEDWLRENPGKGGERRFDAVDFILNWR